MRKYAWFFSLTKEPSEMTSKEFECSLFIAFSSSVQELDESIGFIHYQRSTESVNRAAARIVSAVYRKSERLFHLCVFIQIKDESVRARWTCKNVFKNIFLFLF